MAFSLIGESEDVYIDEISEDISCDGLSDLPYHAGGRAHENNAPVQSVGGDARQSNSGAGRGFRNERRSWRGASQRVVSTTVQSRHNSSPHQSFPHYFNAARSRPFRRQHPGNAHHQSDATHRFPQGNSWSTQFSSQHREALQIQVVSGASQAERVVQNVSHIKQSWSPMPHAISHTNKVMYHTPQNNQAVPSVSETNRTVYGDSKMHKVHAVHHAPQTAWPPVVPNVPLSQTSQAAPSALCMEQIPILPDKYHVGPHLLAEKTLGGNYPHNVNAQSVSGWNSIAHRTVNTAESAVDLNLAKNCEKSYYTSSKNFKIVNAPATLDHGDTAVNEPATQGHSDLPPGFPTWDDDPLSLGREEEMEAAAAAKAKQTNQVRGTQSPIGLDPSEPQLETSEFWQMVEDFCGNHKPARLMLRGINTGCESSCGTQGSAALCDVPTAQLIDFEGSSQPADSAGMGHNPSQTYRSGDLGDNTEPVSGRDRLNGHNLSSGIQQRAGVHEASDTCLNQTQNAASAGGTEQNRVSSAFTFKVENTSLRSFLLSHAVNEQGENSSSVCNISACNMGKNRLEKRNTQPECNAPVRAAMDSVNSTGGCTHQHTSTGIPITTPNTSFAHGPDIMMPSSCTPSTHGSTPDNQRSSTTGPVSDSCDSIVNAMQNLALSGSRKSPQAGTKSEFTGSHSLEGRSVSDDREFGMGEMSAEGIGFLGSKVRRMNINTSSLQSGEISTGMQAQAHFAVGHPGNTDSSGLESSEHREPTSSATKTGSTSSSTQDLTTGSDATGSDDRSSSCPVITSQDSVTSTATESSGCTSLQTPLTPMSDIASPTPMSHLAPPTCMSEVIEYIMNNLSRLPAQDQTFVEVDKDLKTFVQTAAFDEAVDLLESSPEARVIISGPPRSGKRTLAHALLRHFENLGLVCHIIKSVAEFRKLVGGGYSNFQQTQIILLEHIFGETHFEKERFDEWKRPIFDVLLQFCQKGRLKVVFTMYSHVLQFMRSTYDCVSQLFGSMCEVKMCSLNDQEKSDMLKKHLIHIKKNPEEFTDVISFIINVDSSEIMFPECCRRWVQWVETVHIDESDENGGKPFLEDERRKQSTENAFRPVAVYSDYLTRILHDSSEGECLVAVFTYLLSHPQTRISIDPETVRDHCGQFGFASVSAFQFKNKLNLLWPTVISEDRCRFVNRHAYEGAGLAVGKQYPELVIETADWQFFIQYCVLTTNEERELWLESPEICYRLNLHRTLSHRERRAEYFTLLDRLISGLQHPDSLMLACQHPNLQVRQLLDDIMAKLKLDKKKLRFLTSTKDSVHNMGFLYWSLWNGASLLTEWIFKSVHKLCGKFEKQDLILAVCACCVLSGKCTTLEMFLKYWKKVTGEAPTGLLSGQYLDSNPLTLPLPREDLCFSGSWQLHRHNVANVPLYHSHPEHSSSEDNADMTDLASALRNISLQSRSAGHMPSRSNAAQDQSEELTTVDISCPPIHLAVRYNNLDIVALFVEKYASETLAVKDRYGCSPAHLAALFGNTKIMRALLSKSPPCTYNSFHNTPLHDSCSQGHLEVSRILLEKWSHQINYINIFGQTPLFLAVGSRNLDLVELLIQHGAGVNHQDYQGNTLLHVACRYPGNMMLVRRLLQEMYKPHVRNKALDTALHVACRRGDVGVVQALIEAGADIDETNGKGFTPLHCASRDGNLDIVKTLLQSGANPFLKDQVERTPYECATPAVQQFLEDMYREIEGDETE